MTVLRILPFLLLVVVAGQAQNIKPAIKPSITFSSINQLGLTTGNNGDAVMIQSINGVTRDQWFAGVGVAFDFYQEKTVPLFLSLRRDLNTKMNTPFFYVDGGINFLALNATQKKDRNISSSSPGLFYDAGFGLKLKIKHHRAILLSAGYTLKQVKHKNKTFWGAPTVQLMEENQDRYNALYRRIVFKLGVQL